jgi:PEP-CTERM motif
MIPITSPSRRSHLRKIQAGTALCKRSLTNLNHCFLLCGVTTSQIDWFLIVRTEIFMKKSLTLSISCAFLALVTTPAWAQTSAISRIVPVTFQGVVANDVTNEILIRQPNGSFAPFAGPVPEYPYKKGTPVTLSFDATLPTQAFYKPGGPYTGQVAADGLYTIKLQSPAYTGGGGPGGVGNASTPSISGGLSPASNFGQPTNAGLVIVYDSNADSYSINFGADPRFDGVGGGGPLPTIGGFFGGSFSGPGFTYDSNTGALTNCAGSLCAPVPEDNGQFVFNSNGSANTLTASNVGIYGTAPGNGPSSGNRAGLFSLIFSGSWNLPSFGGGATQVPEPGMMLLFAGGVGALVRRGRGKRRQQLS